MGTLSSGMKFFIKFLFLLLAIVMIAPIGLFIIFDANDFKPQISEALTRYTGHPIQIQGEIKTHYWPWVGLDVNNVRIEQADGFGDQPFATAQTLGLKIPIKSLLKWHFDIDTLKVDNLQLNIVKNTKGQFNWEVAPQKGTSEKTSSSSPPSQEPTKNKKKLTFSLNAIELINSRVHFQDHRDDLVYYVKEINLQGEHFTTLAAPLKGSFQVDFIDNQSQPRNWHADLELLGKLDLSQLGKMKFVSESTQLNWKRHKKTPISAKFSGTLLLTPTLLDASDLKLQALDTQMDGWAKIPLTGNNDISFKLHTPKLVVQRFMQLAFLERQPLATLPVQQSIQLASTASSPRKASGQIHIDHLLYDKLDLYQVKAQTTIDERQISLSPVTAAAYEGQLKANVIQPWASGSSTKVSGQFIKVDLSKLLHDLSGHQRASGRLDTQFDLLIHPKSGLNGTINTKIYNGILHGVDVRYYLSMADSLIRKTQNTEQDSKSTAFGNLNANFVAQNNILSNRDLHLTSNDFYAKGDGTINLNNQTLNYKIKARRHKDNDNNLPLAIRVSGPIQNPSVQPDMDEYVKAILEREVKNKLESEASKLLGGDKKGSKDPGDIIDDQINKGLKKLFKF